MRKPWRLVAVAFLVVVGILLGVWTSTIWGNASLAGIGLPATMDNVTAGEFYRALDVGGQIHGKEITVMERVTPKTDAVPTVDREKFFLLGKGRTQIKKGVTYIAIWVGKEKSFTEFPPPLTEEVNSETNTPPQTGLGLWW